MTSVSHLANCAPSDTAGACMVAANELAGAEVCAALELAPATDEQQEHERDAERLLLRQQAAQFARSGGKYR